MRSLITAILTITVIIPLGLNAVSTLNTGLSEAGASTHTVCVEDECI